MGHCKALGWVMAVFVALPLGGCADSGEFGGPTAPSAAVVSGALTGAATGVLENAPFRGRDSGTFEFVQGGCASGLTPLRTHTTGTGTLIGAYAFETVECFDTSTFTFSGSFTLTAANRDTLSGAYAGHITGFLDQVTSTNAFTATITAGSGRFAGAAGTIVGTGQANLATFEESRTFSGTVSVLRP